MMRMLPMLLRVCCLAIVCAPSWGAAQVQQSWLRRYAGLGNYQHLNAGPVLGSNAVYVAGTVHDISGDPQFGVVRYSGAGVPSWAALRNPAPNQNDSASAVAALPDGHVVVTGKSGPYDQTHLVTIKLAADGSEVWSRRFTNAFIDFDQPTALAHDSAGNIYAAAATSSSVAADVITIKYSAEGTQQWFSTFTGAGGNDHVAAITVDEQGNVYLAGRSQFAGDWQFYTLKYNSNGDPLWTRRYSGPLGQQDAASSIAVDASGNVYVAGASLGQAGTGGTRYQFALLKYDSSGTQLWATRYGQAENNISDVRGGMLLDGEGNVLVLANMYAASEQECLLIKFDGDGNRLWTARYNAIENGFDNGYALALDDSGNAYIAGVSDGPAQWQFATLKYDTFGNRVWVAALDVDGAFDFPVGIALDFAGSVYVAGQSSYFEGPGGFLTVKYEQTTPPSGAPSIIAAPQSAMAPGGGTATLSVTASGAAPLAYQWRYNGKRMFGATNSSLVLSNATLELSGQYSVEVTNSLGSVASPEADLLVLISPTITSEPADQFVYAGTEAAFTVSAYGTEPFQYQWLRNGELVPGGTSQLLNLTNAQVADAGEFQAIVLNLSGAVTSAVARLTVSRLVQQEWAAVYDGPGKGTDENPIVKLDGMGNAYVAGTSRGSTNPDFAVIKYNPAGERVWTARYSAEAQNIEALFAMEVDPVGNVWVTGSTSGADGQSDALTVSFDPTGAQRWARRFGSSNLFEAGFALALDTNGHAYVAGQTGEDFLTVKYDFAGNQLWVADFNGSGNASDAARSIAIFGTNVYVTGSSWNGANLDFLTLKYDVQGRPLWQAIYDAAETDNAVAVAVDPSGNVVVAGNSYGTIHYDEFGSDFVVVKYSPNGLRLWSARYDGFMNAEDYPSALAVDAAGNIYVTGHSDFESPDSGVRQFATLKYDPTGGEVWRAWHIGRQYDGSRSLVVDPAGSVYITSLGIGPLSGRNFGFIKYDSRGNRIVSPQFNGPGNADDVPSTLALDASGNVYVAGGTAGATEGGVDFALVKYSQNAVPGLPSITVAPRSMDAGRGSNVLFTVTATGDAPLSYQWFFNGAAIEGASNNVFEIVSAQFADGGSYSVRVGNAHGSILSPSALLAVLAPPSIVTAPNSQTAVAGSTAFFSVVAEGTSPLFFQWLVNNEIIPNATNRLLTLSNLSLGDAGEYRVAISNRVSAIQSAPVRLVVTAMARQCWASNFTGLDGANASARAIAAGSDGSVYVTGVSGEPGDYTTMKFNPAGDLVWTARYNGPGNGPDVPTDLVVDPSGNVGVTGWSWNETSSFDAATVMYDADGNQRWVGRFQSTNNLEALGHALAFDLEGNIYVAASSAASSFNLDFVTICYSASGTQTWVARYDGPAHGFDQPTDIAVDSQGCVHVTGISTLVGPNIDFATIKYAANGDQLWVARYNGPANLADSPVRLRLDDSGNVYVAGWSHAANGLPDYALVKYSVDGDQLWAARYDGLGRRYDYASDLVVDPAGNAYLTGTSETQLGDADWITLKFNPAGERLWLASYGGRFGVGDSPAALAFDALGNICFAGSLYTGESYDAAAGCYDTNGTRRWTAIYSSEGNANEFAVGIATDPLGHLFVTGSSVLSEASQGFLVKYAQSNVVGAPRITAPPLGQDVLVGAMASFSVGVEGQSPLNLRWLQGRSYLNASFDTNHWVTNASDASAGYYSVEAGNDLGTVVSPAAELRVDGPAVPRLSDVAIINDYVRVVMFGERGFYYRFDSSWDLRNWEIVATNYNQNSSIVFTAPLSATRRYYRAVKLP